MTLSAMNGLSHDELLQKLCVDMYFGRGERDPSITVRLDRLERLVKGLGKLFWAVIGVLVATLCDIVVHVHVHT